MRLKRLRAVREFLKIIPVGLTVTKQHMHQGAGQCAIGPRAYAKENISLFRCSIAVGIDDDDFRASFAAGFERMGHYVDLGAGGIGAPDNDQIRLSHFPWVYPGQPTHARLKAIPCQRHTDSRIHPGIAFGMAQAVNTVAHHQAHGPSVVVRPDAFAAMVLLSTQ